MTQFSLAELFGMTIRESANDGSDFSNPSADFRRLFLGEDGFLHVKDSAGAVTDPYTGGGVIVQDEGTPLSTTGTTLNFVGSGVAATGTGATKTITISGGGTVTASGARVYNNGNIALNNGSLTILTFDSERWDDAAYHSGGSPGRLTVPSTGRYMIGAHIQTTAGIGDPSYILIRRDGSATIAVQAFGNNSNEAGYISISTVWDCTGGTEYFELGVNVQGGSKNALLAASFSPEFWIERMGDT